MRAQHLGDRFHTHACLCMQAPRLDGQHVAFGCVQSGLEVLKAMERNGSTNGTPTAILEIQACGELPPIPTLRARSPLSPKGAHTPVGLRTPVGSHTQGMLGTPKASKLSSLKKHNSSKNFT